MIKKYLKKILPRKLLPRLLMIFLIPLISVQCSVVFFFYERHWEKIINRFSNIASNNINLLVDQYNNYGLKEAKLIATKLNISLNFTSNPNNNFKSKSKLEKKIHKILETRVDQNIKSEFYEDIISFSLAVENGFLKINFPRKYLLSETPTIYLLWIVSTSLILSLIAFLFLRIQIRAIHRLAKSAEDFGKGKKIKHFKPEGALEIRAAGNAFMQMQKRINNYINQKISFLTGISHDLGTIITRIKLRLELLDNKKDTQQIKKDVEIMQIFLKEYLEYSKEEKIKKLEKVNLLELLNQVVNSSKLKNKKINIKCHKSLSLITDKNSLYRIVFNLFENASRYGTKVDIIAKKEPKNVKINILDNGPGIKDQFRQKIFKPFFKIDDSRNINQSGSGLGLSISRELGKKINASIKLEKSRKIKGSLFSIILPQKK